MNIKFTNARILTMNNNESIFEGELYTSDDKIVYVGKKITDAELLSKLPDGYKVDRIIDCENDLLMPGFKNAHAHSGMSVLRSMADDMPLSDWLNIQIFPREAKLNSEMIYDATQLSVLEYLTSGITSCFDMYLTPESIAKSYKDMGFRGVLCGNVNNFASSVDYTEEMFNKLNSYDPLISYKLGFHAEYTCSKELLESFSEMVHRNNAPVYTHLSETEGEVKGCIERYGKTPVAFLDALGMWDFGGGAFHCTYVNEDDIKIMCQKAVSAITNPGSNTKLASGIAPIPELLSKGVNIGIGTDGPASNNCLDMFREMFLVTGLAKLKYMDAATMDALDVLKMATVGSAKAMGLDDCDVLEAGKQADIIRINLRMPNMQPIINIEKNIVYSGSKINVAMTMIAGKILYENGVFADSIDVEKIYNKATSIMEYIR